MPEHKFRGDKQPYKFSVNIYDKGLSNDGTTCFEMGFGRGKAKVRGYCIQAKPNKDGVEGNWYLYNYDITVNTWSRDHTEHATQRDAIKHFEEYAEAEYCKAKPGYARSLETKALRIAAETQKSMKISDMFADERVYLQLSARQLTQLKVLVAICTEVAPAYFADDPQKQALAVEAANTIDDICAEFTL